MGFITINLVRDEIIKSLSSYVHLNRRRCRSVCIITRDQKYSNYHIIERFKSWLCVRQSEVNQVKHALLLSHHPNQLPCTQCTAPFQTSFLPCTFRNQRPSSCNISSLRHLSQRAFGQLPCTIRIRAAPSESAPLHSRFASVLQSIAWIELAAVEFLLANIHVSLRTTARHKEAATKMEAYASTCHSAQI